MDVDACPETTASYSVTAMPTFVFLKNKVRLARIQGADPAALENKVRELVGTVGSIGDSTESDVSVSGHIDLVSFINKSQSECLNESDQHNFASLIGGNGYLESDCDEQLIINLAFNQPVKLHSIKIKGPSDKGPKNLKLFINQPHTLDFDQADSMEPVQKLEVSTADLESGKPIQLRYVKFQNVQNLLVSDDGLIHEPI